jgi:hypothetical protein
MLKSDLPLFERITPKMLILMDAPFLIKMQSYAKSKVMVEIGITGGYKPPLCNLIVCRCFGRRLFLATNEQAQQTLGGANSYAR